MAYGKQNVKVQKRKENRNFKNPAYIKSRVFLNVGDLFAF